MKQILFLSAVCISCFASAQGFQVSLQGQRQQAMAGAGTAYVQDGATLFYNPGGVSFLKNNSASLGVTPAISHTQYADKSSSTVSETNSPVAFPFTGYFVLGKKNSKLKYGLAAYTPFGSGIKWQDGWTGRFILTQAQLFAIYIQPTLSYKISEKLGIGAGFIYSTGKLNLQKDFAVIDENGDYAHAGLNGNASGTGFNAGVYYKPITKLSFGLTYRSQVKMNLKEGQVTFQVPASLTSNFPNGKFSTAITFPDITTLGVAWEPSNKWAVVFDANKINWKSYDTVKFDYEKNTAQVSDNKLIRNYKNTFALRLGAQYTINSKVAARAGIKYLGTPVPDGYLSPDVPDASHINYSVGFGYKFNSRFGIDASFTFQHMAREGQELESGLQGKYVTNIYMPGLSFNYNF